MAKADIKLEIEHSERLVQALQEVIEAFKVLTETINKMFAKQQELALALEDARTKISELMKEDE